MKVLHLLAAGEIGGIEVMIKNFSEYSNHENYYCFLKSGGVIAQAMKDSGKHVIVFGSEKFSFAKMVRELVIFCDNHDISVVISHHEGAMMRLLIILFSVLRPNIRTIAYMHSVANRDNSGFPNLYSRLTNEIKFQISKMGFFSADGVIAISECVKNSLSDLLHLPLEHIDVIYNGVELSHVANKSCRTGRIKLIYVGRLAEIKGVQNILLAISRIKDHHDVFLDIVGDGAYRETLEDIVTAQGLTDMVKFHGNCLHVFEKYSEASIFVHMPECEEGFGLTVVEAMSAGCICVCAAKGGIPEIITDGIDGYLVKEDSVDELSKVLDMAINHYKTDGCVSLCQRAIHKAQYFSIEKYCENLDSYIDELCESSV